MGLTILRIVRHHPTSVRATLCQAFSSRCRCFAHQPSPRRFAVGVAHRACFPKTDTVCSPGIDLPRRSLAMHLPGFRAACPDQRASNRHFDDSRAWLGRKWPSAFASPMRSAERLSWTHSMSGVSSRRRSTVPAAMARRSVTIAPPAFVAKVSRASAFPDRLPAPMNRLPWAARERDDFPGGLHHPDRTER